MGSQDKPIRFSAHAGDQINFRGTTREEVERAIRSTIWTSARSGRLECLLDIPYNSPWNGVRYATKRLRPIFVDEAAEIVVVTVYV